MRFILVAALLLAGAPATAEELMVRSHNKNVHVHNKSFFAIKSEQVMRSFFQMKLVPSVEREQDSLQRLRDRDDLLVPAGRAPSLQAGAFGGMMLGAAVVLVAHAPEPVRVIVDGPVHVGPALFDHGGMGAGIGGRF
jgi:hypothetical protein